MYIYKTTNLINGKFYIGKSEKPINESTTYYGSGILLKKAIKKYGKDNFKKEIIDTANDILGLDEKEQYWIDITKAKLIGYNIADGGTGGNTGGMKLETKLKKSEIGDDGLSEFQRQSIKGWKNRSEETIKESIRKANESKQRKLDNGLTVAQYAAKKAAESRDVEKLSLNIKNTWKNKSQSELERFSSKMSEVAKNQHKNESIETKILRKERTSAVCSNSISAYNIVTRESKRISINEYESNQLWVGQTWKGFYEIKLPERETIILTRVLEIEKLAKEIGVDKDWIVRRNTSHLPFKHRVKRHQHLDGTVIIFHTKEDVEKFFKA